MAHFSSGTVSYMRRINTGNYEHKEAKAEISWGVGIDEPASTGLEVIKLAEMTAIGQVERMLGVVAAPTVKQFQDAGLSVTEVEVVETPAVTVEVAPRKPGRPRKTENVVNAADPTPPPAAPVAEISTEDFLNAITRKNAERLARPMNEDDPEADHKNRHPSAITTLVGCYVDPPKKSRDILVEQRAEFLVDLAKL